METWRGHARFARARVPNRQKLQGIIFDLPFSLTGTNATVLRVAQCNASALMSCAGRRELGRRREP